MTQGSTAASSGTCPWEPCGATRRLVPMEWQQDSIPTWDSGYINLIQVYRGWSKLSKSPSLRQWEQAVSMETAVGPLPPRSNLAAETASHGERGAKGELPFGRGLALAAELPYKPRRSHSGTCFAIAPTVWVTVINPPSPTCTPSHWLNLQSFLQLGLSRAISDWLNQADSHSEQTGS